MNNSYIKYCADPGKIAIVEGTEKKETMAGHTVYSSRGPAAVNGE